MNLARIVASFVKIGTDFADEVTENMAAIDKERATRGDTQKLSAEEQQMIDAIRAKKQR